MKVALPAGGARRWTGRLAVTSEQRVALGQPGDRRATSNESQQSRCARIPRLPVKPGIYVLACLLGNMGCHPTTSPRAARRRRRAARSGAASRLPGIGARARSADVHALRRPGRVVTIQQPAQQRVGTRRGRDRRVDIVALASRPRLRKEILIWAKSASQKLRTQKEAQSLSQPTSHSVLSGLSRATCTYGQ